jgi:hypothetical protein
MNHATVKPYTTIVKANFAGLIQGLIPVTIRPSNGAISRKAKNSAAWSHAAAASTGSRRHTSTARSRIRVVIDVPCDSLPEPARRMS